MGGAAHQQMACVVTYCNRSPSTSYSFSLMFTVNGDIIVGNVHGEILTSGTTSHVVSVFR